jgi:hypothetical protein
MSVGSFAAGNIYWYGSEHSPGPNLEPGFKMGAMNASNGEVIWNITFWKSGGGIGGGIPIASQYMTELNAYDNQIYCFGRGPTQTTLQTPLTAITSGAGLIIQGTVMDISAGTTQTSIAARFPNGVPVVSDADQTPWMEYVYMQNPAPTSASGVPVTLTFIDPNGNTHVDTVTTQGMSGAFSYVVPSDMIPVDGLYTVVASFDGTGAYAPSVAQSSLLIGTGGGGGATPTPTGGPTSTTDQYFLPFAIAIIIILIVGIALIMLMLRKRP